MARRKAGHAKPVEPRSTRGSAPEGRRKRRGEIRSIECVPFIDPAHIWMQTIGAVGRNPRLAVFGAEDDVQEKLRIRPWHRDSFAPPGQEENVRISFHGLRDASEGVAPPVATTRRPVGAEEDL